LGVEEMMMIRSSERVRTGISRIEVVVVLVMVSFLSLLVAPLVLHARERARIHSCSLNSARLVNGLQSYHDIHGSFPPAANWDVNSTFSIALHESKHVGRITRANWLQMILPLIGEEELASQFDDSVAIGHDHNKTARTTWLSKLKCPSDQYHNIENLHRFYPVVDGEQYVEFARGNYAINGGTHNYEPVAPNTYGPQGDYCHLFISESPRQYQMWGNGIAGINKSFSLDDFQNAQSTTIAVEEIRVGIHEIDPRGAWALGQIGGSITWGHGVCGDTFCPNNQDPRSDDLLRANELHRAVGSDRLEAMGMPCVSYIDMNQQATARSMHTGGVNVAFLDGSVKMISDRIDPGLWHVLHSRETPADELNGWEEISKIANFADPVSSPDNQTHNISTEPLPDHHSNDLGMQLVKIPAGEFEMGLPNNSRSADLPECPPHRVEISSPFLISKHEVTQGQFSTLMDQEFSGEDGRFPVVNVSWYDAERFCLNLSAQDKGWKYRLPTEAEWEYVCREGRKEPYIWHRKRPQGDDSGDAAGIMPFLPISPVGSYPPNAYGVHDMRGNVWEWTADWFDRDYYSRSPAVDPAGPSMGFIKVVRGSDWRFIGEPCLLDYPMMPPWKGNPCVGFRVVAERSDAEE